MTVVECLRARLIGPRDLRFEPISLDIGKLAATQIFALTEYTAVSLGTEKAAYIGLPGLRPGPSYPRFVGYCNVAKIVVVGADVKGLVPGQRVLTHQSHQSGFICDAADVLAVVPMSLDSRTASVTYIAHIALTALQRARFRPGETVLVQGLGPIGLAAVALAHTLCAGLVIAIGNNIGRQELAKSLGSQLVLSSQSQELSQAISNATDGRFADVVVTTVNSWAAWQTSLSSVRQFGRIAVLGFPGRGEPSPAFNPLESQTFYVRQLSILSAGQSAGPGLWGDGDCSVELRNGMRLLLNLTAEGKLPLRELISHEVRWSELANIYSLAESGDKTLVSAVLHWDQDLAL